MFFHGTEHCNELDGDSDSIIVWIEPEKHDLVRSLPQLVQPIAEGDADIVILTRSKRSFVETYPAFQVESETQANEVYAEATGLSGFDPMSGPVAFRLSMAKYFVLNRPKKLGLEDTYISHYAPLLAMMDGHKVVPSPEIYFFYPREQREEETALTEAMKTKRKWQLDTLSNAYRTLGAGVTKIS